jgi:hypothetical protein
VRHGQPGDARARDQDPLVHLGAPLRYANWNLGSS